jgi:hypothetical protein
LASLGFSLVIAWFVAGADNQLANAARSGAQIVLQRLQAPGRAIWFSGHWGFQWYMEAGGAKPITVGGAAMHRGDAAVFPFRNSRVFGLPDQTLEPLDITCIPLATAMATMDKSAGAGFYSDVYGPLPYATGNRGRDCYGLMELRTGLVIDRDGSWVLDAN